MKEIFTVKSFLLFGAFVFLIQVQKENCFFKSKLIATFCFNFLKILTVPYFILQLVK